PVDLLTVCFDENSNFASPDRLAAELAHAELCELFPSRQWNLVKINIQRSELSRHQREVQRLMAPCDTHMDFNIGAAFWFLSRGRGQMKTTAQTTSSATLDELNAFLKPKRGDLRELETEVAALSVFGDQTADEDVLLCPVNRCGRKRKTGCVVGICKSCCLKMQRAVEKLMSDCADHREAEGCRAKLISMGVQSEALDLLLDLLKSKQQERLDDSPSIEPTLSCRLISMGVQSETLDLLLDLLKSKQKERLDDSPAIEPTISCRVHRTKQVQNGKTTQSPSAAKCTPSTSCDYETRARVVLVGIGADEQLAGYGRHRTTLINGGEEAMRAELQMDLSRIWKRNLGRDDRCIASHGREARFPFLDENVVSTIATFPVSSLCDAELPRGVGDKRALRLVAKSLGLRSCAGLAKRAIQFGSRIAKVSNSGSNRQTQGMNKFSSVE
ncbi:Asparagine synthetase, partial [Phytophthora megakarya]